MIEFIELVCVCVLQKERRVLFEHVAVINYPLGGALCCFGHGRFKWVVVRDPAHNLMVLRFCLARIQSPE